MKHLLIILLLSISFLSFGQDNIQEAPVNKKGKLLLPQAGDWAIGINGQPFLDFAGRLFTESNYSPIFSSANPGSLYGKYMLSEDRALRIMVDLGTSMDVERSGDPQPEEEHNITKTSALSASIGLGLQKYRHTGSRLLGFYGIEAMISKNAYYGPTYQSGGYVSGKYNYENPNASQLSFVEEGGNYYYLRTGGFFGFEYFFAPRISVSCEFGIGLDASMRTDRLYIPSTGNELISQHGEYGFGIYTDTGSLINLFFYF